MMSICFDDVYVLSSGAVGGPKEKKGPLGDLLDQTYEDYYAGKKNFESGEAVMMKDAVTIALKKASLKDSDLGLFIAGDLNNQISCSSKVAATLDASFIGIYGACSTSMLGVALAAILVEKGAAENALVATSSSFGSAERQFRYPNEYGLPKRHTTTLTVTGAGAIILSKKPSKIRVKEATIGQAFDVDFKDVNDLGTAMSFAAYNTIKAHLKNHHHPSSYYDLILTGDLSDMGSDVLLHLFKEDSNPLTNHADCGKIIYSRENQKVFSGGSGSACCPLVTYTEMFNGLLMGRYQRILVVATGALHDPVNVYQKKSIPAIAHAITFERA